MFVINQHGIISNLPLNIFLGDKKIISNALTIFMNNYKFNITTQDDQVLHFTATGNTNSDEQFHDMISNLRPLQSKAYNIVNNYITNNTTQLGLFLTTLSKEVQVNITNDRFPLLSEVNVFNVAKEVCSQIYDHGGTGKSKIIEAVVHFTRKYKNRWRIWTNNSYSTNRNFFQ